MIVASAVIRNLILVYATAGLGFLASLYLASAISISQYADYAYAVAIGAMLYLFVNAGSDRSLVKDISDFESDPAAYINFNSTLKVVLFLIVVFVLFLTLDLAGALVCAWYLVSALFPKGVYDYYGKTTKINCILFLDRALFLLVLLLAVNRVEMASVFAAALGVRLLMFFVSLRQQRVRFVVTRLLEGAKIYKQQLSSNALLVAGSALSSFQILGAQVFSKYYASEVILSFLSVGFQISALVQLAQMQAIRIKSRDISTAANGSPAVYVDKLKRELVKALLISIPFATAFGSFVYLCEMFLLGEEWSGFFIYMVSFIPWLLLIGPGIYISQYFLFSIGSWQYLKIYLVNFLLTLLSLTVILPWLGPYSIPLTILLIHGSSIAMMYNKLRIEGGK